MLVNPEFINQPKIPKHQMFLSVFYLTTSTLVVKFTFLRTGARSFRNEGNHGKDVCEVTCLALEDAFLLSSW